MSSYGSSREFPKGWFRKLFFDFSYRQICWSEASLKKGFVSAAALTAARSMDYQ